jgi:hypothetical protein
MILPIAPTATANTYKKYSPVANVMGRARIEGTKDAASARLVTSKIVTIVWESAGTSVERPSDTPTIAAASPNPMSIFFQSPFLK